jgi:hypothetical protein
MGFIYPSRGPIARYLFEQINLIRTSYLMSQINSNLNYKVIESIC